jgi:hypothetical protein
MGGLGLGSVLLGGRCEKSKRPLAFYANLEIGIALFAAVTPFPRHARPASLLGARRLADHGPGT